MTELPSTSELREELEIGVHEAAKFAAEENGQTVGEYITSLVIADLGNHDLSKFEQLATVRAFLVKQLVAKTKQQ